MTKGLQRSLSRGPAQGKSIIKETLVVDTTVTVSATGSAVGYGTAVIGDFPEGYVLLLGGTALLEFVGPTSDDLGDTWEGDFGIGITPLGDATISGADEYIVQETAVGPAVAEAIGQTYGKSAGQELFVNTDNSKELNLNLLIDAANIGDDTSVDIAVTGVVHLVYVMMGDDG